MFVFSMSLVTRSSVPFSSQPTFFHLPSAVDTAEVLLDVHVTCQIQFPLFQMAFGFPNLIPAHSDSH